MQLSTLIIDTLQAHGKAVVPGWGTFLLVENGCSWDAATNTAFPSGKFVRFTKALDPSNKLVVAAAKRSGGNIDAAQIWLRRKVQLWQSQLDRDNLLVLEGLGTFRNHGQFLPDQVQYDAASFGFSSVMLHPIHVPSALEARMSVRLKGTETETQIVKFWQKAAAAAAVAALMTVSFWQTDLPTQAAGWVSWSTGLAQEVEAKQNETAMPSQVNAHQLEAEVETVTAEDETVTAETTTSNAEAQTAGSAANEPSQAAPALNGRYTVVVGAFTKRENAENFLKDIESLGWEARIAHEQLYIVRLGQFQTREGAVAELAAIKKNINEQAWICAL